MNGSESAARATGDRAETKADYAARLRERVPPGSTVYTILRHVSRSRMMRVISCYVIRDNEPVWVPSPWIARVTTYPDDEQREGNKLAGAGEDKGFRLVYDLACAIYADLTPEQVAVASGRPQREKNYDVGYTLTQRWL